MVTVYDVKATEESSFIVMELVQGASLLLCLGEGQFDLRERVRILEKVCRGVQAAHEKGIVHRDLKPANILVTPEGDPKVADFGVAQIRGPETNLTQSGDLVGTPAYMSPEQVRGEISSIGPVSDVYALGVILYEMITGRVAFSAGTPIELYGKIVSEDPLAPRKIRGEIDPDLETICMKAMEKDLSRRYPNAGELSEDLARYLEGSAIEARPPSAFYRIRKTAFKRRAVLIPVLVSMVVLAAVTGFLLPRLQDATKGKTQAEEQAAEAEKLAAAIEVKRKEGEAKIRERKARLDRARPYLDQGRRIIKQIEGELANSNANRKVVSTRLLRAEGEFKKALEIVSDYAEVQLEMGRLALLDRAPPSEAMNWFTLAIQSDKKLVTAYIERVLIRLENYCRHRFDVLGNPHPLSPGFQRLLDEIQDDLEEIREWSRNQDELQFAEGIFFLSREKNEEAARILRKYAVFALSDYRAWRWLAFAELRMGDLDAALGAVGKGLQSRPAQPELLGLRYQVRTRMAQKLFSEGRVGKAKAGFKTAREDVELLCRLEPEDPVNFYNLGFARRWTGDLEGALEAYTKAIEIKDDLDGIHMNRGIVFYNLGKFEEAIRDFTDGIQVNPRNEGCWVNRGRIYAEQGKIDLALSDLDEAVRLNPNLPMVWATAGDLRIMRGDFLDAKKNLERALEVSPGGWPYRSMVEERIRFVEKKLGKE